ncbi:type IV CRISPR-associated protein Csf1 [Geoalkalibacter subterraneus]|uniref:Uncharacterized protein n=1 Tax=Geoalkalibacter subterraneus TaxID=483547 RepID=A0A0B5FJ71_9BACT|nr:type IV CRISPR-associated protein Csf1 [Geoalkalibacter subterraneus]AJF08227.1 hypothetical protein GSUB_17225 [Geoalkalibacter subterraneus]
MLFNPTEFACKALGLEPQGEPWGKNHPVSCTYCGRTIEFGDLSLKKVIGSNFLDAHELTAPGTNVCCGWCAPCKSKSFLARLGAAVITEEGAYSILSDANRTWFLLTPPKPPFMVFARSIENAQHLVWRTPMTYDIEAIQLRFGPHLFVIRHSVLLKSIKVCERMGKKITAYKQDKAGAKKNSGFRHRHPFASLDRMGKGAKSGVFLPHVQDLCHSDPQFAEDAAFIRKLSDGELWGLATLMKQKPEEPIKPQPVSLK